MSAGQSAVQGANQIGAVESVDGQEISMSSLVVEWIGCVEPSWKIHSMSWLTKFLTRHFNDAERWERRVGTGVGDRESERAKERARGEREREEEERR